MGWLPIDSMHLKPKSLAEAGFLYHTYANKRGEAYIESMERFVKSIAPIKPRVSQEAARLTQGAHTVVQAVRKAMNKLEENDNKRSALSDQQLVRTERGQVEVSSRLRQVMFQSQQILDDAELELIRRDGVDINTVLKPVTDVTDSNFSSSLAQTEVSALLEGNVEEMQALVNMSDSEEQRKQSLERVRRRLMCLASKAPQMAFFPIKDPLPMPSNNGPPVRPPFPSPVPNHVAAVPTPNVFSRPIGPRPPGASNR